MVDEKFMSRFYENKPQKPKIAHVGGQFSFNNLPKDAQEEIKGKLREKDPVVDKLAEKKAVGVIIDGKPMTQEWADQLDLTKPEIKRDDGIEIIDTEKGRIIKKDGKIISDKTEKPKAVKKPEQTKLKAEKPTPEVGKLDIPTREELKEKAEKMGFTGFRKWAVRKYKVTGRSVGGLINDVLKAAKTGYKEL